MIYLIGLTAFSKYLSKEISALEFDFICLRIIIIMRKSFDCGNALGNSFKQKHTNELFDIVFKLIELKIHNYVLS